MSGSWSQRASKNVEPCHEPLLWFPPPASLCGGREYKGEGPPSRLLVDVRTPSRRIEHHGGCPSVQGPNARRKDVEAFHERSAWVNLCAAGKRQPPRAIANRARVSHTNPGDSAFLHSSPDDARAMKPPVLAPDPPPLRRPWRTAAIWATFAAVVVVRLGIPFESPVSFRSQRWGG